MFVSEYAYKSCMMTLYCFTDTMHAVNWIMPCTLFLYINDIDILLFLSEFQLAFSIV